MLDFSDHTRTGISKLTRHCSNYYLLTSPLLFSAGSFKIRGIGRTCQVAVENGAKRLVGSSGGNAGLAMAYAAQGLGTPLSLFIPTSTPKVIQDKAKVSPVLSEM